MGRTIPSLTLVRMNGFDLPPLSAHPASGTAKLQSLSALTSSQSSHQGPLVAAGLSGIEQPWATEPLTYPCDPTPLKEPVLVAVSEEAAACIGESAETIQRCPGWAEWLSGGCAIGQPRCYATVYAGHQFGVFVPRLGDGRALNLGALNGWELQLKGAGPTPFARHADGRAVLRSSVREFLCSEAMHGLGIATTRALSLVVSQTPVVRERLEPAAVVCRIAPSFLRFGHFEYFAYRAKRHAQTDSQAKSIAQQQVAAMLRSLSEADPEFLSLQRLSGFNQVSDFLAIITRKTACLMADWMSVGFMHGVMNTDNFSALGLTIDYGPFSFMEAFDPNHICNHSDHEGRYRYATQPSIGFWNLQRLISALAGLHDLDLKSQSAQSLFEEAQSSYETAFYNRFESRMRDKLGLDHCERTELLASIDRCFLFLQKESVDFTHFFRSLGHCQPFNTTLSFDDRWRALAQCLPSSEASRAFITALDAQLKEGEGLGHTSRPSSGAIHTAQWSERRLRANPAFVLRNWVLEEVIRALEDEGDVGPLHKAMAMIKNPFDDSLSHEPWHQAAPDWAKGLALSCSS
ncbi:MAG: protein adenylyltransferase SelO [Burkholderiaceae bacterium]